MRNSPLPPLSDSSPSEVSMISITIEGTPPADVTRSRRMSLAASSGEYRMPKLVGKFRDDDDKDNELVEN